MKISNFSEKLINQQFNDIIFVNFLSLIVNKNRHIYYWTVLLVYLSIIHLYTQLVWHHNAFPHWHLWIWKGMEVIGPRTPLQKFSLIECKYIVISYSPHPPPPPKKTLWNPDPCKQNHHWYPPFNTELVWVKYKLYNINI